MVERDKRAAAHSHLEHPLQPLYTDEQGTTRFKDNAIVSWLVDTNKADLNEIAMQGFPQEDQEQFAQLHGYSLGGFGELSYVSNKTWYKADKSFDPNKEDTSNSKSTVGAFKPNIILDCAKVKFGCSDQEDDFGNEPSSESSIHVTLMEVDLDTLLKRAVREVGKDQVQLWLDEQ